MTTDQQPIEARNNVAGTIAEAISRYAPVDLMNDKRFQQYVLIWANAASDAVLARTGDLATATGLARPADVLRQFADAWEAMYPDDVYVVRVVRSQAEFLARESRAVTGPDDAASRHYRNGWNAGYLARVADEKQPRESRAVTDTGQPECDHEMHHVTETVEHWRCLRCGQVAEPAAEPEPGGRPDWIESRAATDTEEH